MNILKIAALADYFYALAGILQVPPALEQEMTDWALSVYCQHIVKQLEEIEKEGASDRAEMMPIFVECHQYISKYPNAPITKTFLSQSAPYISDKDMSLVNMVRNPDSTKLPDIQAEFVTSSERAKKISPDAWHGLWSPEQHIKRNINIGTLYVYREIPKLSSYYFLPDVFLKKIESDISSIKSTVHHELQHFVQTFVDYARATSGAGFPSARITTPYITEDLAKDTALVKQLEQKIRDARQQLSQTKDKKEISRLKSFISVYLDRMDKKKLQIAHKFRTDKTSFRKEVPHHLRDIEFYTVLRKMITNFQRVSTKYPLDAHTFLFYLMTCQGIDKVPTNAILSEKYEKFLKERDASAKYMATKHYTDYLDTMWRIFRTSESTILDSALFFYNLREHQPMKYQKAIKEFYKEVSSSLTPGQRTSTTERSEEPTEEDEISLSEINDILNSYTECDSCGAAVKYDDVKYDASGQKALCENCQKNVT